jgi:metallophosphoesterase superfamily enzyme
MDLAMRVEADWLLTVERAAVHLPTATAVIADPHLGYDHARRQAGEAVPALSLDDTLATLSCLLASAPVRRLVIAGDLVENQAGAPVVAELGRWLLDHGVQLLGVPGNHDRGLLPADLDLPLHPDGVHVGRWRIVHGDRRLPGGPLVLGHFHPCLRWPGQPPVPCFLLSRRRLFLPAFSPDAAGVNVLRLRRWRHCHCHVIAGDRVLDFGLLATLSVKKGVKKGTGTLNSRFRSYFSN